MTDAELIAQLRAKKQKGNRFDSLEYEAADRIELLEYMNNTLAGAVEQRDATIEVLETKLAKAMGALKFYAYGHITPPSWQYAHKTVAEIEGMKHV